MPRKMKVMVLFRVIFPCFFLFLFAENLYELSQNFPFSPRFLHFFPFPQQRSWLLFIGELGLPRWLIVSGMVAYNDGMMAYNNGVPATVTGRRWAVDRRGGWLVGSAVKGESGNTIWSFNL